MRMDFQAVIAARRDGRKHTQEELAHLAKGAGDGSIPDYQLAAWLMAAYLNPLDSEETGWLTMAMADSGERLDLSGLPKPWVDKHSTGGVGDKTSIVLLPLLASCGLTVVKMSGRGLGITGGTVDKLGSIPGFRLDLSPEDMKRQAGRIGLALTGQTPNLAPADKVLYALRDVTATVDSVPLIVSSILSKKLAGGAETVVLDVKCGRGGFMADPDKAGRLAEALSDIGARCGLKIRIAVTDMDQPLGSAVGNALEVREAIRVLEGEDGRFPRLCIALAGLTLEAAGLAPSRDAGESRARTALADGSAASKAQEWFVAQGATADPVVDPSCLPAAPLRHTVHHEGESGWVSDIDAGLVGQAVVDLGGGRHTKNDEIDRSVGVESHIEVGTRVEKGAALMTVHAATEAASARARRAVLSAVRISPTSVGSREAILRVL